MIKSCFVTLRNVAFFLLIEGIVGESYSNYGNDPGGFPADYSTPQTNQMYPQHVPRGPAYAVTYQPQPAVYPGTVGQAGYFPAISDTPTYYQEPYGPNDNWNDGPHVYIMPYPSPMFGNATYNGIVNVYDPEVQLCCQGHVYSNSYTQCCGHKAYDTTKEVCCNQVVYEWKKGFSCCGIEYFNIKEKICCNEYSYDMNIVALALPTQFRGNENAYKFCRCCGKNRVYDTRTERCCHQFPNYTEVIPKTDKTVCRQQNSFYALPAMNVVGMENQFSSAQQYCGSQIYDPSSQLCCGVFANFSVVQKKKPTDHCCGKRSYTPGEEVCCTDNRNSLITAVHRYESADSQCCGINLYSISKEICCPHTGVIQAKVSQSSQCCGNQSLVYDRKTQICCGDTVFDLPEESRSMRQASSCCLDSSGQMVGIYDWRSQRCCDGVIVSANQNEVCCGKEVYNQYHSQCCGGVVVERNSNQQCCAHKTAYEPAKQICCPSSGIVINKSSPGETYCCGSVAYNPTKFLCCGSNVTQKLHPKKSQRERCCGESVVNPDQQQKCCPVANNGRWQFVVVSSTSPTDRCCGGVAANPHKSLCCNGTVVDRQDQQPMQCCGRTSFNPRTQICCEGNVFQKEQNNSMMECCGPVLIDKRESKCCAGLVKPATSPYAECCFG